jgi:plastocyanin
VAVKILVASAVVALLGAAGSARADNPVLTGDVGASDAFVITLKDPSGAAISHVDAGTYTLVVHDHSSFHNFHLSGPGVDVSSTVDEIADHTFTITLVDGTYFFDCDPHSSQMKGSFTVGTATTTTTTTTTTPPPPVAAPKKLAAAIGPGATFSLKPASGLAAGKFSITVADRTATDGFRLAGPGVAKATGAKFKGTVTWTVTLKQGTYSFGSTRTAKKRRTFTVSG